MWTEIMIFQPDATLEEVIAWASRSTHTEYGQVIKETLTLQVANN